MEAAIDDHLVLNTRGRATKTVVSASEWTIGGNMDQSELENLVRAVSQHNARMSLESGVLKVRLGRG